MTENLPIIFAIVALCNRLGYDFVRILDEAEKVILDFCCGGDSSVASMHNDRPGKIAHRDLLLLEYLLRVRMDKNIIT
jgi:hypothetical protein